MSSQDPKSSEDGNHLVADELRELSHDDDDDGKKPIDLDVILVSNDHSGGS